MEIGLQIFSYCILKLDLASQEDLRQHGEESQQAGEDLYLFNLDHFMLMHQELELRGAGHERVTLPNLPHDPTLPKNWYDHPQRQAAREANGGEDPDSLEPTDPYLVIDARVAGVPHFCWQHQTPCSDPWPPTGLSLVNLPCPDVQPVPIQICGSWAKHML